MRRPGSRGRTSSASFSGRSTNSLRPRSSLSTLGRILDTATAPREPRLAMAAPKLLDRMRARLRTRHYSIRTEEAYVQWAKRFILFQGKKHPSAMGAPEVNEFLTHLAVERNVSASTQSQALAAILFLYRDVLAEELPWLNDLVRAPRRERIPVVLSRDEVRLLLGQLSEIGRASCRERV